MCVALSFHNEETGGLSGQYDAEFCFVIAIMMSIRTVASFLTFWERSAGNDNDLPSNAMLYVTPIDARENDRKDISE